MEGFSDLAAARAWVQRFADWYNLEHRHSQIKYVTPVQRHDGEDAVPLEHRHALYQQAKAKRPERCSGEIRDWEPVGDVMLNPDRAEKALFIQRRG
jgi:putative transposase